MVKIECAEMHQERRISGGSFFMRFITHIDVASSERSIGDRMAVILS